MTTNPVSPTSVRTDPDPGGVADADAAAASRSEAGSAYLATLLVLVVLTILGLSLAVVTQTEVLIGGSEKQATRQLFAAGSGVELAATYELVKRDSASHDLRIQARTETLFGVDTAIADVVCTTPYLQIHTGVCNLCAMNQDTEYAAVQYGVTTTALRRGDAELGARKTVGAVVAFEPFQKNFSGYQLGGDRPLKTPDDLTEDVDPTTVVDPCEGLYLKI
jgi:Tfp pilus assembly protein PilX